MFCECSWGGGRSPPPAAFFKGLLAAVPPLQGQPNPTWNVSTSNWNHRKKLNPKIFPHPVFFCFIFPSLLPEKSCNELHTTRKRSLRRRTARETAKPQSIPKIRHWNPKIILHGQSFFARVSVAEACYHGCLALRSHIAFARWSWWGFPCPFTLIVGFLRSCDVGGFTLDELLGDEYHARRAPIARSIAKFPTARCSVLLLQPPSSSSRDRSRTHLWSRTCVWDPVWVVFREPETRWWFQVSSIFGSFTPNRIKLIQFDLHTCGSIPPTRKESADPLEKFNRRVRERLGPKILRRVGVRFPFKYVSWLIFGLRSFGENQKLTQTVSLTSIFEKLGAQTPTRFSSSSWSAIWHPSRVSSQV